MKYLVVALLLMLVAPVESFSQGQKIKKANAETVAWRYEIEVENVGLQGACNVKVWSFSKNPAVATEQAKKNAVHGMIFKGVADKAGIKGKKPLVADVTMEEKHAEFFKNFFAEGGEYMKYVAYTTSGQVGAGDVMKVSKKSREYKVGVVVTVQYDQLRKRLEQEGIVKKLNQGF